MFNFDAIKSADNMVVVYVVRPLPFFNRVEESRRYICHSQAHLDHMTDVLWGEGYDEPEYYHCEPYSWPR